MKHIIMTLTLLLPACVGEPFQEDLFTGGAAGAAGEAGAAGSGGASGASGVSGSAGEGGGGAGAPQPDAAPDAPAVCPAIEVKSAVYAASCGVATTLPTVFTECDGLSSCDYVMSNAKDPGSDIAPGCWKDLTVVYACVWEGGSETKSVYHAQTYDNLVVELDCGCPS